MVAINFTSLYCNINQSSMMRQKNTCQIERSYRSSTSIMVSSLSRQIISSTQRSRTEMRSTSRSWSSARGLLRPSMNKEKSYTLTRPPSQFGYIRIECGSLPLIEFSLFSLTPSARTLLSMELSRNLVSFLTSSITQRTLRTLLILQK